MNTKHYRAEVYGNETVPYIQAYYVMYQTPHYDMCTNSLYYYEQVKNLSPEAIRKYIKQHKVRLYRIANTYSRIAKKTPLEAIQAMIGRKIRRREFLAADLRDVTDFLSHVNNVGAEQILQDSIDRYSANF